MGIWVDLALKFEIYSNFATRITFFHQKRTDVHQKLTYFLQNRQKTHILHVFMYFRCENRVADGLKMYTDHIESLFDGLRPSRWSLVLGQQDILLCQQDMSSLPTRHVFFANKTFFLAKKTFFLAKKTIFFTNNTLFHQI